MTEVAPDLDGPRTAGAAEDAPRLPAVHERPWAAGAYLAFASLAGLAFAAPLAAAIGSATGAYPRGDAELFDPGGVMLIEVLRHLRASSAAIGAAWAVLAVLALPLGMIVLAFCTALLGAPGEPRPAWALARAARSLPTLASIALVVLVADALLIALVMVGGGAIVRATWPYAPARDIARWSLLSCAFLVVTAAGVLHDLARVAAVTGPSGTYTALAAALRTARRHPGRVAWSYTWRALLGLGAACAAAWLGTRLTPRAVLAAALVHQLGLAAMGWLRLTWLSSAIRLISRATEPESVAGDPQRAPPPEPAPSSPAADTAHDPLA